MADILDPPDQKVALAGSSKDYKAQAKIAALLEEGLSEIRATARTNDYFVGYSLTEAITERLNAIGKKEDDESEGAFVPGTLQERTELSKINFLWGLLLGTDEGESADNGGAIGKAASLKDINDPKAKDDEGEQP